MIDRKTAMSRGEGERKADRKCSISSCDREWVAKGLCSAHYQRLRKGVSLDVPIRAKGKGESAPYAYQSIHIRLRRRRGSASDYPCRQCGAPALDWALNHTSADQLYVGKNGLRYSRELEDYDPMCRTCHRRYDQDSSWRRKGVDIRSA